MSDPHSEIEFKWDAGHVSEDEFMAWAATQRPESYERASFPDVYYAQGDNIVRHRWSDDAGELTVKRRKTSKSIVDRVEVDLRFAIGVKGNDVTVFLQASGWKRILTLFKVFVHVFRYRVDGAEVTIALYEVEQLCERTRKRIKTRRFLEVEVEKGSPLSDRSARLLLESYKSRLEKQFHLTSPVTESLFEIYTGRRYQIMRRKPARSVMNRSIIQREDIRYGTQPLPNQVHRSPSSRRHRRPHRGGGRRDR